MAANPFALPSSRPGHGSIILTILPPATSVLHTVSYQYPLKIISPASSEVPYPGDIDPDAPSTVHTAFLLTYGGGLVAGDVIVLDIDIAPSCRLLLLTQGSTKIFKSPNPRVATRQTMTVKLQAKAALLYLPDPVQPYEASCFEQNQTYELESPDANLCVCDWVSQGRASRGESWSFARYASRNEIRVLDGTAAASHRLLLRDNLILEADSAATANLGIPTRMDGRGVFGTLIIGGKLFASLAQFFLDEFMALPRIGSRQWDATDDPGNQSEASARRVARADREHVDRVLWSASATRGFVVVKFGAREVEGARRWLRTMLQEQGTVERVFGERSLLCLR